MTKTIEIKNWTVDVLYSKIVNKEMKKPKYQRKKRWLLEPNGNSKIPNIRNYIEFLIEHGNSVHSITLAKEGNTYYNIDGNNRLNAISRFIEKPFEVFSDIINEIKGKMQKNESIPEDIIEIVMNELVMFNYETFVRFDTCKYFRKEGKKQLWDKVIPFRDDIDDIIEPFKKIFMVNGTYNFVTNVMVNLNIFEGYSHDELSHVFTKINRFNTNLTETEIQASLLYSFYNIEIEDDDYRAKVFKGIEEYYLEVSKDEALECYLFRKDSKLNAFDFMVGLQKAFNRDFTFIEPVNTSKSLLFLKLYKLLYVNKKDTKTFNSLIEENFSAENVNDFISNIAYCCDILQKTNESVFVNTVDNKLFNKSCSKKLDKINSDRMFLLIAAIIGFKIKEEPVDRISKEIKKCILFHFMLSDIIDFKKEGNKEKFKSYCSLSHNGAGQLITGEALKLLDDPTKLNEKITKKSFSDMIKILYEENCNPIVHSRKKKDRRKLKFFEKTLMFFYYKRKVPCEHLLENEFSIEHIVPFSSNWTDEIDTDRTGNLVPIFSSLNSGRSNKHINYYLDNDECSDFCRFFTNILPEIDTYNTIVCHQKKPVVKDNNAYNSMCSRNENEYLNNFISSIF